MPGKCICPAYIFIITACVINYGMCCKDYLVLLLQAADLLQPGAKCAGKAYFITNADPQPFWRFLGDLLEPLGYARPSKKLPWQLIFVIAVIVQFIISLLKPFKVPLPTKNSHALPFSRSVAEGSCHSTEANRDFQQSGVPI